MPTAVGYLRPIPSRSGRTVPPEIGIGTLPAPFYPTSASAAEYKLWFFLRSPFNLESAAGVGGSHLPFFPLQQSLVLELGSCESCDEVKLSLPVYSRFFPFVSLAQ